MEFLHLGYLQLVLLNMELNFNLTVACTLRTRVSGFRRIYPRRGLLTTSERDY